MNWTKLAERKPQEWQSVLARIEVRHASHLVRYSVAWHHAGQWRINGNELLRPSDKVTHWTKIEQPSDVLADAVKWKRRGLSGVE